MYNKYISSIKIYRKTSGKGGSVVLKVEILFTQKRMI